jgi:hypothetical protein
VREHELDWEARGWRVKEGGELHATNLFFWLNVKAGGLHDPRESNLAERWMMGGSRDSWMYVVEFHHV